MPKKIISERALPRLLLRMLAIMIIPASLTYYAWHVATENLAQASQAKFETMALESERALRHRMDSYHQALLGGRGLVESAGSVSHDEWKAYVNALDVATNFPGINGIGIIEDVQKDSIKEYTQKELLNNNRLLNIHPDVSHNNYYIIRYIEPESINLPAIGLNIAFEKNRTEAADRARDSGKAAITKRILLVQDAQQTPGFLLLAPIYNPSMPINTAEQRQKAFLSWVYAPFIGKNFMNDLTESQGTTLNLEVHDGADDSEDSLIYKNSTDSAASTPLFTITKELQIMQRTWLIKWSSTASFESQTSNNEPLLIAVTGSFFTLLCGIFVVTSSIRNQGEVVLHRNRFLPAIGFCFISVATLFVYNIILQTENELISKDVKREAEVFRQVISSNVNNRIEALSRMADRWTTAEGSKRQYWQRDAQNLITDHPGLKVVEWVDPNYQVQWVEPLLGNERVVGLNILFNEERQKALEGAAAHDKVTLTPPLDLVQGYKAFISYFPVRKNGEFDGFIAGILSIEELMRDVLQGSNTSQFAITLSYDGAPFYHSNKTGSTETKLFFSEIIELHDKQWSLSVTPSASYLSQTQFILPETTLIIGFVLSLLIAQLIFTTQTAQQKTALVQEKENLLATFVRHTPAAVAMFDTDVRYLAMSSRWQKDYGLQDKNVIGKSHYEVFPEIPIHQSHWLVLHKRAILGEVIISEEEPFLREDGAIDWIRYELHPWSQGDGSPGGLIMFTENITERKKMDSMKDEFISTVNHELRTPITSIMGALGLLRAKNHKQLDPKSEKLLGLAYENSERLSYLVNDILDTEKIAAGKMNYDLKETEMVSLVVDIVEQNSSYAERHSVKFVTKNLVSAAYCNVDAHRFNQALTNLLSNAAKFSPTGEDVEIRIEITAEDMLHISVTDNGPGISKTFHSKIFDKFSQEDGSSTRTKGGTGLGLNITKTIIEAFAGEVSFVSTVGKGSTFSFHIPTIRGDRIKDIA
ncbi:CHASE domain-containing protein [Ahrensia kielensis]|uniref:histidine kinase n=1 Tax=Ahrensia kielensis TaxID=76980 RepID=A0ABU9T649_9HYPH